MQQRVLRSTLSNMLGKAVTLGAGFVLTPFILHRLGPITYGLWMLVGSVVAYGALFDFGISSAITKYIAEAVAQDDEERAQQIIATALRLYTGIGAGVLLLSVIIALNLPRLFPLAVNQHATAVWLMVLMGIATAMAFPCTIPIAILRGLQRYDAINLVNIIGTLLSMLLIVVVLLLGGGILGMVSVSIPVMLIMQGLSLGVIQRLRPRLGLRWQGGNWSLSRAMISFSSSLFALQIAGQIQAKTDEIVIGVFLPVRNVTPYAIARRISELPQILADQFLKVLLPLATELHTKNDQARLRFLYITSTRLTLILFLPVGGTLVMLARPILTSWLGAAYANDVQLIALLTLARLIDISVWPVSAVLPAMARHQPIAIMAICSALANLALSIILVQRMGVTGVAVGTLIPTTIECLGFVFPYTMRVIGVSVAELLKEVIVPAAIPLIPMVLFLYWARQSLALSSLLIVAIVAGMSVMLYGIGYFCLSARDFERQLLREMIENSLSVARTGLRRQ